jgi:hypothetical protein
MNKVKIEFKDKCDEIEKYFIFLEKLDKGGAKLTYLQGIVENKDEMIKAEITTILKASAYLMLYNLIESTMRSSILEIYKSIKNDSLSFRKVQNKIQRLWIKFEIKDKHLAEASFDTIQNTIIDMIKFVIEDEELALDENDIEFSGNLDAQEIRNVADNYGFKHIVPENLKGGEELFKIKKSRNDLAHGFKSFIEVGGEYSFEKLKEIKDQVVGFLNAILDNIETYINNKDYKFKPVETLQSSTISQSNNPSSPSHIPI